VGLRTKEQHSSKQGALLARFQKVNVQRVDTAASIRRVC
jgi:hypothetical protein